MLLIQKLHDCGLMREIWPYLFLRDISCLITVNKDVQAMSIRTNEEVSQMITLDLNNRSDAARKKILSNMMFYFPNIFKLTFKSCNNSRINKSLRILYNCESICRSLQDLTVCIGTDEGVKGISCLRNIKYLNISNSLITNDAMSDIGSITSITSLDCSYCESIGDDGLLHISKLSKLKLLNINSIIEITDFGLSHLLCLTNITSLDISRCMKITTLSSISSMTNITSLNLSHCSNLTDYGFSYISLLINIKLLNLFGCKITTLSPVSSMTNMTSLNLTYCRNLTDQGLSFISSLVNMTLLNISYNVYNLTDYGISLFSSSLLNVTSLDISYCYRLTTLLPITSMVAMTSLNLSNSFNLTDQEFSFLSSMVNMSYLKISRCNITTLSPMSSMTNLTSLNISECRNLTDEGFSFISSLVNITLLNIFGCNISTLSSISSLTNLTILDISKCRNLRDQELSFISSLINLTDLNIHECYEITDNGLFYLTSLVKIIKLDVSYCKISNVGLYHISCLTNIQILTINLRNGMTNEGFTHLCKLTHLNKFVTGYEDFIDINLSPDVIYKLLNISEFQSDYNYIVPDDDKVEGFLHVLELRKQRNVLYEEEEEEEK